uniref:ADAMTS/ADAMTS-like cysteine-rich domain-containing protein n=1 Tax=Chelydra serpentina TaxID=8475 RepID=A0A8C3RZ40_CHESE
TWTHPPPAPPLPSRVGTASRTLAFGLEPQPRHRRQPGRGEWTPWGGWSACSSTCGSVGDLGGHENRSSCPECPASSLPFRALQCALYDGKPIPGSQARYRWAPFHGAPNLCDLNCLAVGHNFYYTFGRALDGTRCSPDSPDLCISGQCLTAGCDGILGSSSRSDACGLCDGRDDSCLFVRRVFRAAGPCEPLSAHGLYRGCCRGLPPGVAMMVISELDWTPGKRDPQAHWPP